MKILVPFMAVTVDGQIIANVPQAVEQEQRPGREHALNQLLSTEVKTAQCLGPRMNSCPALLRCVLLMVTIATGVHSVFAQKVAVWEKKQERENVIILSLLAKEEIVLTLDQQLKASRATLRHVQSVEVTHSGLFSAHVQNLVQVGRIFGHATAQILDLRQVDWIVHV